MKIHSVESVFGSVGISKLWVEDGVLHAEDVLKAKFHEQSQLWHVYHTDTYWPVMVIESVPTAIEV